MLTLYPARRSAVYCLAAFALVVIFLSGPYPAFLPDNIAESFTQATCNARATETPNTHPRLLLVSAMFPLPSSKHSLADYDAWLKEYLQHITTDIYFYTTPAYAPNIERLRPKNVTLYLNTTFSSPFDVPHMQGRTEDYQKQHETDREKAYHNPDLYAIWNAKPFLLDAAVQQLQSEKGLAYDYAFWSDAGTFRLVHPYTLWPGPSRVQSIFETGARLTGVDAKDLFFVPIVALPRLKMKAWEEGDGPIETDISEGTFFGGSPSAVRWWAKAFYAYHDFYLQEGYFVGKDQSIINAVIQLFPERVVTVWGADPAFPSNPPRALSRSDEPCDNIWHYFVFWLAGRDEQDEMNRWRLKKMQSPSLWPSRRECRITPVLSYRELLHQHFGSDWKPPVAKVRL